MMSRWVRRDKSKDVEINVLHWKDSSTEQAVLQSDDTNSLKLSPTTAGRSDSELSVDFIWIDTVKVSRGDE